MLILCFFFKQKTAYEIRMSDWSSDVCSSDLHQLLNAHQAIQDRFGSRRASRNVNIHRDHFVNSLQHAVSIKDPSAGCACAHSHDPTRLCHLQIDLAKHRSHLFGNGAHYHQPRSEEHTSELQSLMRISYAVFCLQQKNTNT